MPMTLNHLHLASTNLDATVLFYATFFGFAIDSKHGDGVFLKDSKGFLLAVDPVPVRASLPEWFHFGFCLDSEQEVLALYEKARKLKAPVARDLLAADNSYASFYLEDPDGRRVEVSWHAD